MAGYGSIFLAHGRKVGAKKKDKQLKASALAPHVWPQPHKFVAFCLANLPSGCLT
jgi:hypothetical protein